MAAHIIQRKSIAVCWIAGYCQLSDARDAQQHTDILRNHEVERLAKLATTLPLPLFTPTPPSPISLRGTQAPTPSKKWMAALRPYLTHCGVHWVTWLPLRARPRQAWLQWLWGNISSQGCSPPWERTKVSCELCHDTHRGTPHARLVQCAARRPVLLQEWVRTWGPWVDVAQQWLTSASPEYFTHISKLRIPQSFVDPGPQWPMAHYELAYLIKKKKHRRQNAIIRSFFLFWHTNSQLSSQAIAQINGWQAQTRVTHCECVL